MRQVILDTETTGLSWEKGNRVVEIGCIELVERRPTRRHFHRYLNPDREMEPGAAEVTGLTLDFLRDKPRFEEVAAEFLDFIRGAELVIHNAAFDVGFLNAELGRLGPDAGTIDHHAAGVLDTLALAKQRFPGQRNSLDALCKRLGVDNGDDLGAGRVRPGGRCPVGRGRGGRRGGAGPAGRGRPPGASRGRAGGAPRPARRRRDESRWRGALGRRGLIRRGAAGSR